MDTITEHELREAYQLSGMWRSGWTFKRAIETSLVLKGLQITAKAIRARQMKHGKPAPLQQAIELGEAV